MKELEAAHTATTPLADMSKHNLPSYAAAVPLAECFDRLFDRDMKLQSGVTPMKTLKIRPAAGAA
jgi:hypothetical protein